MSTAERVTPWLATWEAKREHHTARKALGLAYWYLQNDTKLAWSLARQAVASGDWSYREVPK